MRIFFRFIALVLFGGAAILSSPIQAEDLRPLCIIITSVEIQPENCDQGNGSITVNHDGTAPFTYTWTGTSASGNVATGLSAGSYRVRIEDAAGCDAETTLVVPETIPPILSIQSITDAGCAGGGAATIVSSDPTATATWNTSPAQTGLELRNVSSGTYVMTALDSVGCESDIAVVINGPDPMVLSIISTPDTCGAANGTATVTVLLNGTPPFSYRWSGSTQTTARATGLAEGNYTVTVTDADNCEASASVAVGLVSNLLVVPVVKNTTCFGGEDGAVQLNVSGGTGNYRYEWKPNVSNTSSAQNLSPGVYNITVTDIVGEKCKVTGAITVGEAERIRLNLKVDQASGCGIGDGLATVDPLNVKGPYVVLWDTFQTDNAFQTGDTAFNLYPGIYDIRLEDSAGCTANGRFVVQSNDGMEIGVKVVQEDDCGLGQGAARVDVLKGTPTFRYKWFTLPAQPGDFNPVANNLTQGTFTVVVSDTNNCVRLEDFTIRGNRPLKVDNTAFTPSFCGNPNGTATATFSGGVQPYRYTWNTLPVQTNQTATGLISGYYRVAIADQNNCRDTAQVYVEVEGGFDLVTQSNDVTCFGWNDGSAEVSVVGGGQGPFTYLWNTQPPQTGARATGLLAGSYLVSVTDANGCVRNATVSIQEATPLTADFTFSPDTALPVILGQATFAFKNLSEGATGYRWIFGDGKESFQANPVHTYKDTGTFYVTLFTFNNDQVCRKRVEYGPFIVKEGAAVQMATAFSPNDDGINDVLSFPALNLTDFSVNIYDRWGREVFAATSPDETWNGTLKNGGTAPEGVYVYRLYAVGVGDVRIEETGTITLFR